MSSEPPEFLDLNVENRNEPGHGPGETSVGSAGIGFVAPIPGLPAVTLLKRLLLLPGASPVSSLLQVGRVVSCGGSESARLHTQGENLAS